MVTCQSHNLKIVGSIPISGNFIIHDDLCYNYDDNDDYDLCSILMERIKT